MVTVDGCILGKGSKVPSDLNQRSQQNSQLPPASEVQSMAASVHSSTSSSRSGSLGDEDGNISSSSGHDISNSNQVSSTTPQSFITSLGNNFKILPATDPVRELQTIIRDKNTSRSDFVFYADRLVSVTHMV